MSVKYLKISNLVKSDGNCDYKGLNLGMIIAGSQVYDLANNLCLIATTESFLSNSSDVALLTEDNYAIERKAIEDAQVIESNQVSNDDMLQIKETQAQIVLALVEGGLM